MSFSVTFKVAPDQYVSEAFEAADILSKETAIEAGGDLLTAALETADGMAGDVAELNEPVQVSISGHWNGSLAPKAGWGPNFVTITVTQIYNEEKA